MALFKKANKKLANVKKPLNLMEIKTPERFLAVSPEFKAFIKKNRGVLSSSFNLLVNNIKRLEKGRAVRRKGISIKKAATGSYKGHEILLLLKFVLAKKSFL